MILLYLTLLYVILVFVGIRLVIPYYGFKLSEINNNLPKYFLDEIIKIDSVSNKGE